MMKVLYLLMVYHSPEMVERIISRLDNGNNIFVIHVDSGAHDIFDKLKKSPNLKFTKSRYRTAWGSPELVYATIDALKESLQFSWDYVCLLSESDYPVKSPQYITDYLKDSNKDHILINKLPHENPLETPGGHWLEGGRRRIECYALRLTRKQIATIEPRKFNYGNFRQIIKVLRYNPKLILRAFKIIIMYPKRYKTVDFFCAGHQWFFLRRKTIEKILKYIDSNKRFYKDTVHTSCLDEIFFPTVVNALIDPSEISGDILRYIYWTGNGKASPQGITLSNKQTIDRCITSPNILIMRKVEDSEVCDYVDKALRSNAHLNPVIQ